MRLRASLCLLKLAHVKTFDKIVSQPTTFELVGGTVQVSHNPAMWGGVSSKQSCLGSMLHG